MNLLIIPLFHSLISISGMQSLPLQSLLALQPAKIESLVELRKKFSNKQKFEVNFSQVVKQSVFPDSPDKAVGKIKIKRPHHMEWVYEKPSRRVIKYDGRNLSIKEGDEETVVHPTGGMSLHESFSFLWGQPNPDIFRIKPIDKTTFRVIPIERDSANFKYIDVSVKKGFVDKATVYDHLDGTSILHFHDWNLK